jgi:broad specificity phosphatase PhoE
MVRLLFIRHAESEGNYADETTNVRVRRGELDGDQALEHVFSLLGDVDDLDHPLTILGHEQAEMLGEFYFPLLEGKAREGKLHLWVSPQLRTMQTASPLYSRLHQATGIKSNVRIPLHEFHPPYHKNALPVYKRADTLRRKLRRAGNKSAEQIDDEVNSFFQENSEVFLPTGMTPAQMRRDFNWCIPPPQLAENSRPFSGHQPRSAALQRAQSNAEWLVEMQHQLEDDEVIVVVSHGGIMGMTLRCLLQVPTTNPQRIQLTDIPNSCVHVINLPNPKNPDTSIDVCLEVFGSTDHLGPNRITELLANRSGTALRPGEPASEWLKARGGVGGMDATKARL